MELIKDWLWKGFVTLMAASIVLGVLGSIFNPDPNRPREGKACGPGHVWGYVGTMNPELSCEKIR